MRYGLNPKKGRICVAWVWNREGTEKLVNGKQHSVWFVRTWMNGLPQNVLLNFRLEFPIGDLTIYLPSGTSEIFCQMVSTLGLGKVGVGGTFQKLLSPRGGGGGTIFIWNYFRGVQFSYTTLFWKPASNVKINTKETLSWLCAHTNIMCFFLKQQQNCHTQMQQDFLANSSPTEFLCLHISSNILHFWQTGSFYLITGSWHKKIYCDLFARSAALRPWKLVLLALPLFLCET